MDLVKVTVLSIVGFLLGAGLVFAVSNILVESEYTEAEDIQTWKTAKASTTGIEMSDSDFWDDNGNGVFDKGEEEELMPDKLSDIEENYIYGTNATNPDTDGDGMLDGWEAFYMIKNPVTDEYTIDPNVPDGGDNPDGDGLDLSGTSVLNAHFSETSKWDGGENLTNLEEYCGGDIENIIPDKDDLLQESLRKQRLREIAESGGFHLSLDITNPVTNTNFTYEQYNPWQQRHSKEPIYVTTNPSSFDSDGDGMGDFYELYHGGKERPEARWGGAESWHGEKIYKYNETKETYEPYTYRFRLDPLDPTDADQDIDISLIHDYSHVPIGGGWKVSDRFIGEKEFRPDGLTNLEEYEYGTDPLNWDTDGDTFERPEGGEYRYHDSWEVSPNTKDTDPTDPDTDGDAMWDAWETHFGLDPLNASDRFLDLDGDTLPNYLEFAYPSSEEKWWESTDPLQPDTDGDGMPDGWEAFNALLYEYDQKYQPPAFQYFVTSLDPTVADGDGDVDTVWVDIDGDKVASPGEYNRIPDNVTNFREYKGTNLYPYGTDPNNPDTDGDGLTDGEELLDGFSGELIEGIFYTVEGFVDHYYTNASNADTDMDFDENNDSRKLDDWEEVNGETHDGKFVFPATNASNPDTDLDGLEDVAEVFGVWMDDFGWVFPNPTNKDSDFDDLDDADEVYSTYGYITHPTLPDTDFDQLLDGKEVLSDFYPFRDYKNDGEKDSSDPRNPDTDSDGISDGWEAIHGKTRKIEYIRYYTQFHGLEVWFDSQYASNKYDRPFTGDWANFLDVNGDGMVDDELPAVYVINPLYPYDGQDDADNDGLTNIQEMDNTTDPLDEDTDDDGLPDGWEIKYRAWVFKPSTGKWGWFLDPTEKNSMGISKGETIRIQVWNEEEGKGEMIDVSGTVSVRRWNAEKGEIEDVSVEMDDGYWSLDYQGDMWYPDGAHYQMIDPEDIDPKTDKPKMKTYYHPLTTRMEYEFGKWDPINGIDKTLNPNNFDCDNDGMGDGKEVFYMDRPVNESRSLPYEDNDTLARGWEVIFNLSVELFDTDYKPTGHEIAPELYKGKFWPTRVDSDDNGIPDGEEDYDGDGKNNTVEYLGNSDPTDANSVPNHNPFEPQPGRSRGAPGERQRSDRDDRSGADGRENGGDAGETEEIARDTSGLILRQEIKRAEVCVLNKRSVAKKGHE